MADPRAVGALSEGASAARAVAGTSASPSFATSQAAAHPRFATANGAIKRRRGNAHELEQIDALLREHDRWLGGRLALART
jgi:hypothetical protein